MSEEEERDFAEAWARWKKRVAHGWGPVSAWIAKDLETPPKPPEPQYPPDYSRAQRFNRELKQKQKDEK